MKRKMVIVIVITLAICASVWVMNQISLDSCLDAGGKWDYGKSACSMH